MAERELTPEQRAFVAAFVSELRDLRLWRPGRHDLPVLTRLPNPGLELGDRRSHRAEPAAPAAAAAAPAGEPADVWWQKPYPGGPMVQVAGFPRCLYPPDAAGQGKKPSPDGTDVTAYKRTVSRAGRWPWTVFDDSYSNGFAHGKSGNVADTGVAGVQRQSNVEPDWGWIGETTFNLLRSIRIPEGLSHAGEPAMDTVAAGLVDDAYQRFRQPAPQDARQQVEAAIVDFLVRSIQSAPAWHYAQVRPMENLGLLPEAEQRADCSTSSTDAYYWARQVTGVAVPDPNHSGYNGYGYTGTLAANPTVATPYKIGDLAIYGTSTTNTTHVVTCYVPGSASSAEWCSHGSEEGPYPVELNYRDDLLYVVRPGIMP